MSLLSVMSKAIKIHLSDSEYIEVEKLVKDGFGRTKADFVKTAIVRHTCRCETNTENKNVRRVKE